MTNRQKCDCTGRRLSLTLVEVRRDEEKEDDNQDVVECEPLPEVESGQEVHTETESETSLPDSAGGLLPR